MDWPCRLDKAPETDSYPDRQDLNVGLLKVARQAGARISLGTNAHHPWQLYFIEPGLAAVLKAKIPPERIINFLPLRALKEWVRGVRTQTDRLSFRGAQALACWFWWPAKTNFLRRPQLRATEIAPSCRPRSCLA